MSSKSFSVGDYVREAIAVLSGVARNSSGKFTKTDQVAAVTALSHENFAYLDLYPPPVLTPEDSADFSPESGISDYPMTQDLKSDPIAYSDVCPPQVLTPEDSADFSPEFGISDYPTTPDLKSDPTTPTQSSGREFPASKSKSDVGTSYALMGKHQSQQNPGASPSWWSPTRTASAEQDEGKRSDVDGVVQPGALITPLPPREGGRPELQRNLDNFGRPHEEEWVTLYGFCPADKNLVLKEFEKCGVILKHIDGPRDADWIHILYQNRTDAQRALTKNGTQINSVLTIGVKLVDPLQCQSLNERIIKQGHIREKALASVAHSLSSRVHYEILEKKFATTLRLCLNSIEHGSAREIALAAQVIGLSALTIGPGDKACEILEKSVGPISEALKSLTETFTILALLKCLAIITLVGAEEPEQVKESLQLMWQMGNPKMGSNVVAAKPTAAVIVAAASAWTFLLSTVDVSTCTSQSWHESISYFSSLLEMDDRLVRTVAGEALALIFEIGNFEKGCAEIEAPGESSDDRAEKSLDLFLIHGLRRNVLEQVRNVWEKSGIEGSFYEDPNNLRSTFGHILKFLEEGDTPETLLEIGKKTLTTSTWAELIHLNFIKRFLGRGFMNHMQKNKFLQDFLGFTPMKSSSAAHKKLSCSEKVPHMPIEVHGGDRSFARSFGTTLCSLRYKDGIVMGVDSFVVRTTDGLIKDHNRTKLHVLDGKLHISLAGQVKKSRKFLGFLRDKLSDEARVGSTLSPISCLATSVVDAMGELKEEERGFSAMLGGLDSDGSCKLYSIDKQGLKEIDKDAQGHGAPIARAHLEESVTSWCTLEENEAVDIVIDALTKAERRSWSTGGNMNLILIRSGGEIKLTSAIPPTSMVDPALTARDYTREDNIFSPLQPGER